MASRQTPAGLTYGETAAFIVMKRLRKPLTVEEMIEVASYERPIDLPEFKYDRLNNAFAKAVKRVASKLAKKLESGAAHASVIPS